MWSTSGVTVNPLMGTLKPQISGPLCSNTVIGTGYIGTASVPPSQILFDEAL